MDLFRDIKINNLSGVKTWFATGGNPNTQQKDVDNIIKTPLIVAIIYNRLEIVKLLLEHPDTDPTIPTEKPSDYMYFPIAPSVLAIMYNREEILKELLKHPKINVNMTYGTTWYHEKTLIMEALDRNLQNILNVLLKYGADPNAYVKDMHKTKRTPLLMAIARKQKEIVKLLLDAGADVNKMDGRGVTPVNEAIDTNQPEIATMLIEYGAKQEINFFNERKNTINESNLSTVNFEITKANYTKAINELKKDCPSKEFPGVPNYCWIDSTMVGLTYAPDIGRLMRAALLGCIERLEHSEVSNVTDFYKVVESWNLKRAWKIYITRMLLFFLIGNQKQIYAVITCPLLTSWVDEYATYTTRFKYADGGGDVLKAAGGIINALTVGEDVVYNTVDIYNKHGKNISYKLNVLTSKISKENLKGYEPCLLHAVIGSVLDAHVVVLFVCNNILHVYDNNHGMFQFTGVSSFPLSFTSSKNFTISYKQVEVLKVWKTLYVEYAIETPSGTHKITQQLIKLGKSPITNEKMEVWPLMSYSIMYTKNIYDRFRSGEDILAKMANAPRARRLSLPFARPKTVRVKRAANAAAGDGANAANAVGGFLKRRKTRKHKRNRKA